MLKELEQISAKYKKIAEHALDLKQDNTQLNAQIQNLQQQMAMLIEDKINLEQQNGFLSQQLKQIKNNLENILSSTSWQQEQGHDEEIIPVVQPSSSEYIEEKPVSELSENIPYFNINPSSQISEDNQAQLILSNEEEILINHKL